MIQAFDLGGAERGQVPAPLSVEWAARENELATLKLTYSEHAPRHAVLGGAAEVAYLLPDGRGWVEPANARMVVLSDSWERLADGAKVHSYELAGLASEFARHHLTEGAGTDRTFTSVTAGAMIETFVTEVKAAGGLPWLDLGFTATTDSRGEPWPYYLESGAQQGTQVHTVTVPLRTKDLLTLLQELPRVQWWMQGRTLHLAPWRPGTVGHVHLPDILMTESPEKINHGSVHSHIRVVGDEGRSWLIPVPGANPAYGRRVMVVQAQGVTDEGSARLLAEARFPELRDAAESFTRQWRVTDGTPWLPGRDILVGDWITADTVDGKRRPARVAGMSVQEDKTGRTAFVTLGTIQDGLLLRLAKSQRSAAGGVGVMQGTPKPPPPPTAEVQWPEAPTGLQVVAGTWTAADGTRQGHLSASWDATTVDTAGSPVEVDRYQLRARRSSHPATTFQDIAAPKELTATVTRTDMSAGEAWEVIVAAVKEPRTGPFSAPVSVTVQQDTTPPSVPSAPSVSSTPGTLVVEWDGLDHQGQEMAPDLAHVVAQLEGVAQTWNLTRTSKSVRIEAGPGEPIALASVHRARLKAVDVAGNESDWSDWSGFVTVKSAIQWAVAPTGLVVSAEAWTTSEGLYRGRVSASWAGVTVDQDGQPIDIGGYVVRARRAEGNFSTDWFDLFATEGLSGAGSSDLMEVGDVWEFVVAAVSTDGHTGAFSPAVQVTIPPDTIPPPVPSAPIVTSDLGMLTVEWDGLSQSGGGMPPDLSHLTVHVTGLSQTWSLDTVTRLLHLSSGEGQPIQAGTAYTVRFRAVDHAGNQSALSNAAAAVTVKTATEGLQDAISQIEADYQAADQALQGQIDSIVVSSSGGVVTWMGPTTPVAPAERPHMAGDLWWDTSARTQKRYDGTNWVAFQIGDAGIFGLSAAKITTGYLDAARIRTDAAWVQSHLLVGSADEMIVDPTWQNPDLNADRARAGWTVEPGTVTHTQAVAEDFYLGIVSDWPDARSRLTLRPGVRYRVVATVRLTTAGQVSLVQRDTNGAYSYIAGPVSLAANVDYGLVGAHEWGQYPGTFGVRMDQPGTIRHVSIRPMLSQVLIQDGLITAPKIASEAVTADKLTAGAVTAAKLHADALNFKWARGLRVTGGLIETTEAAYRGIKLTSTDLRAWDSAGTQTFHLDAATGGVAITGELKSSGAYPRIEITKSVGGVGYAGIQFEPGPGWNARPWLRTNAVRHGTDTPGSFYLEGASSTDLTMKPSLILRSGTVVSGTDRYWPQIEMRLGRATHFGHIRIADIGERKTDINMWADFYSLTTKTGQSITMPVPGTVGDIRIWSTNGAVHLNTGNGWLMLQGIGSTTGGQDLALEGGWRAAYRSSLSRDKLDQAPIGALYELLELTPATWVDRARRERDPAWDTRYGGLIFEDVERVSARHGGSLDFLLIRSAGAPSGVASAAVAPALIGVVADMHDRLTRLEEAL